MAALAVLMVVLFLLVELLLFRSYAETERTTQGFKTTTDATTAVASVHREALLLGQLVPRLSPGDFLYPVTVRRGLLERQLDVVRATVRQRGGGENVAAIARDLKAYDRAFTRAYGGGDRAKAGSGRTRVRREAGKA